MQIEIRALSQVIPYENNPRINDEAVDAVAASIREFGFRQPIVVDEDGVVIAGHTRLKAAHKLDMDKVPVIVAKDLTPEQIRIPPFMKVLDDTPKGPKATNCRGQCDRHPTREATPPAAMVVASRTGRAFGRRRLTVSQG